MTRLNRMLLGALTKTPESAAIIADRIEELENELKVLKAAALAALDIGNSIHFHSPRGGEHWVYSVDWPTINRKLEALRLALNANNNGEPTPPETQPKQPGS